MKYELTYRMMCGIDGSIEEEPNRRIIEAGSDAEAFAKATELLRRYQGSSLPWGPRLVKLVAGSNPAHPPSAHTLQMF